MRVIGAKYNRWGTLQLLVDQIPPLETLRFRKVRIDDSAEPGYLYVAEQDGYVEFYYQVDPDHYSYGQGFYGHEFHLRLADGTAETLIGPWSSSTVTVNRHLPELGASDVVLTDDRGRFQDGMVTVAGAITTALREQITSRLQPTRPLGWLRQRYERVEEQLSSTRPTPGDGSLEDSAALQRWATDNVGLFADEDLLLRDIAARTAEVATGAQQRSDIVAALMELHPALGEGDRTLPASLLAKVAVYYESYGAPGETVAEVLRASAPPYTTRAWEQASITGDLDVAVGATANWEEEAQAPGVREEPEGDASVPMDRHPIYQEYVANGIFAAYGQRGGQGPASSLDDHYIGPFGDDWARGEPMYDIGPSGTDEEHSEEVGQYHLWLTARGLRALEASGQKAIPPGIYIGDAELDGRLTPEFGAQLLDLNDPAILAAAALKNRELARTLFNTPNTQHVLTNGELQQLGRDTLSAPTSAQVKANQAAEPWLAGDVGSVLSAARSPDVPSALAAQARTASTAALQAWVEQAHLPHPPWREGWSVVLERDNVEIVESLYAEDLLVLKGLQRELEQMGSAWRPDNWSSGRRQHRADLQTRIAERAREVDRLAADVPQAKANLDRAVAQQQAERAAWETGHGAVLDRGVVAVRELERREAQLLDDYVRDAPERLVEAIGQPPPDPAGRQAWQEQARHLERARVGATALEQDARTVITGCPEVDLARDGMPGAGEGLAAPSDMLEP